MADYALYKGDELLSVGTTKEIAEEMGIKRESILYYGTPTYARRVSERGRRLVKLEEEEE